MNFIDDHILEKPIMNADETYDLKVTPEVIKVAGEYFANSCLLGDPDKGGPDAQTCELYLSEVLNFLRTSRQG